MRFCFRKNPSSLLFALVFILALSLSQPCSGGSEPGIKDIVVCNIYWEDYKYVDLPGPRLSKFVVTFNSFRPVDTEAIESLSVKGPENYTYKIDIVPYNRKNLNGFIETPGTTWFMAFDRRGFLKNGPYTITLKYRGGKVSRKSRVLNYTDTILNVYLKTKLSFSPTGRLPDSDRLDGITLRWTVLPKVKAYYETRLGKYPLTESSGTSSGWVFQDSIFGYGTGNPTNTGLNKGNVRVGKTLQPDTGYLWFTEILDSNNFNQINIAIFESYQYFRTGKE
jgi:hypothetical protein